jgi:transposase
MEVSIIGTSCGNLVRAYSQDLRDQVIDSVSSGPSLGETATRFDLATSTVINWVGSVRESGERSIRKQGRPRGLKLGPQRDFLLPLIEDEPDITVEKIQERLRNDRNE